MRYLKSNIFSIIYYYFLAYQLNQKSIAYRKKGKNIERLKALRKSLAIRMKYFGNNHTYTAIGYREISHAYYSLGNYSLALKYYLRYFHIEMNKKRFNNKMPSKLDSYYHNLGQFCHHMSDYLKAMNYFKHSLYIRKKTFGQQHTKTAMSYHTIGLTYHNMGDYPQALSNLLNALTIQKKNLSKQHPDLAVTYHNLGLVYYSMGNYPQALTHYKATLNIQKRLLDKNDINIGANYQNLAKVYDAMGDYHQALEYHQSGLKILEYTLDKKHPNLAISYNNIGLTYQSLGELSQASEYHQKSLNIMKSLHKNNELMASYYSAIGSNYYRMKNYKKSFRYYQHALKLHEQKFGEQHHATALSYFNVGCIYRIEGNAKKALEYHQRALIINKEVLGIEHPITTQNYNSIGTIYHTLKSYFKSYKMTKKAFSGFLMQKNSNFSILDAQQKNNYLTDNKRYIFFLLSHAYVYHKTLVTNKQLQQATELAQTTLSDWLAYKGSILDYENLLIQLAKTSPNTTIQEHYEKLIQLKRSYSKQMQAYPEPNQEKQWQHLLKQKKDEIDHLEQGIIKLDPRFAEQQQLQTINSKEIAATLAHNELYIDYAKTNDGYYIFTLDSQNNSRFIALDEHDSNAIDGNVTAFRNEITHIIDDGKRLEADNKRLATSQAILQTLYQLLIEKHLSKQLVDKERLIISPDGALRLLPFEALYNEKDKQYFIEQKDIRYIASGKEWMRLQRQVEKHKKAHKTNKADDKPTAVIFANPEFGATNIASTNKPPQIYTRNTDLNTPDCRLSDAISTKFADLPHTDTEANRIINHLGKPYNRHYYEKTAATEKNLLAIKQPKLLHLATHGFFNEKCPNPMLQSGLVLAGANDSLSHDKTDGIITALDLSGLDLKGTELVVLSACETGVVDPNNTEGVSGLTKAFIQAGASNVIMSLWKVADKDSADLMADFYRIRFGGEKNASYSQALRTSKRAMIRDNLHPYYWSGFVLSGL